MGEKDCTGEGSQLEETTFLSKRDEPLGIAELAGKHCFVCKSLDFLPFQCADCERYVCAEHRQHGSCSVDKTSEDAVECAPGADRNAAVEQHIQRDRGNAVQKQRCSVRRCKEKVLLLSCGGCASLVCVKHRINHSCAGEAGDATACRPQATGLLTDAQKAAARRRIPQI